MINSEEELVIGYWPLAIGHWRLVIKKQASTPVVHDSDIDPFTGSSNILRLPNL
jgi:hypothetical protein